MLHKGRSFLLVFHITQKGDILEKFLNQPQISPFWVIDTSLNTLYFCTGY